MQRYVSLIAIGSLVFLTACWVSKKDGETLRRDLNTLKTDFSKDVAEAQKSQEKLKKVLEQATALLTRNSADVGAQVERLQTRVDKQKGAHEETQKEIRDLKQRIADLQASLEKKLAEATKVSKPEKVEPTAPPSENKDELYNQAQSQINAGKHAEARRLLRYFLSRYGTDERAALVQLMLGDSYYTEQKFAPAIQEYRKILERYKESKVFPNALYKTGMCFYQLKFCSDATPFFNALIKQHKSNKHAGEVRQLLRLMKKHRRNRRFCTS
jgi:TolA-binding protein